MKSAIISLLLILVLIFASCKKADEIPPVIKSMNISVNDTLRNNFTIKVDASDNKSVERVEYYVNDSLIIKISTPPYDYELNTLKLKDGQYTMKTVAYDPQGNKMESSSSFVVQNVLLSLHMGSLYPGPYYIVVADEKGNILNTGTYYSNERKKIMPLLACEEEAINIVYYNTSYGYTAITAFIHVKRGSELKMDLAYNPGISKGVKLHLKNDITSFSNIDIAVDQSRYTLGSMADTLNLPAIPYISGNDLLLQVQNNTGKSYKFYPINNVQSLSVNLSSINTPETMKSIAFPASGQANCLLMGRVKASDFRNDYFISSDYKGYNADHLDLFYPAEYFTVYRTFLFYTEPTGTHKIYTNMSTGIVPETFSFMDADAQITSSTPAGFKVNFSGIFDFYELIYRNTSANISMNVTAPADKKEWVLPDLNTAFANSEFSNNKLVLNQITLRDFESINSAKSYYDLSLDIERLSSTDSHIQSLVIPMFVSKAGQK